MPAYDQNIIREYLQRCDDPGTSVEKGRALEDLTRYLFSGIPGVTHFESNLFDEMRSQEIDVIFDNEQHISPLSFIGMTIVVECKNTSDPIAGKDVSWFINKIITAHASIGILISLKGITGDSRPGFYAHETVHIASLIHRVRVLIVRREDIESLIDTEGFVKMLRSKCNELTLKKTRS